MTCTRGNCPTLRTQEATSRVIKAPQGGYLSPLYQAEVCNDCAYILAHKGYKVVPLSTEV